MLDLGHRRSQAHPNLSIRFAVMNRTIALLLPALLFASCVNALDKSQGNASLGPPQFTAPKNGESANVEFNAVLQKRMSHPCVSVTLRNTDKVTLVISEALLEHLVLEGKNDPYTWAHGDEKGLLGTRANEFLTGLSSEKDKYGCLVVSDSISSDSDYLLGTLIAAGQLTLVSNRTGEILPSVIVRYSALAGIGGEVWYLLPQDAGGDLLFTNRTWVASAGKM